MASFTICRNLSILWVDALESLRSYAATAMPKMVRPCGDVNATAAKLRRGSSANICAAGIRKVADASAAAAPVSAPISLVNDSEDLRSSVAMELESLSTRRGSAGAISARPYLPSQPATSDQETPEAADASSLKFRPFSPLKNLRSMVDAEGMEAHRLNGEAGPLCCAVAIGRSTSAISITGVGESRFATAGDCP